MRGSVKKLLPVFWYQYGNAHKLERQFDFAQQATFLYCGHIAYTAGEDTKALRILILGGGGFLGQKLGKTLADSGSLRGEAITQIGMADVVSPAAIKARVPCKSYVVDIADRAAVDKIIENGWDVVFHLAAVVSAHAEEDFVAGMRTNFFGTFNILEACRAELNMPIVVYASSVAAFSTAVPQPVEDWTATVPQTSYGTQKAVGELLLNDYSRREFIDGRGARLPTVVVRPGKPNKAASSFFSSIIREPLQGEPALCPVELTQEVWLASPRSTVENLVRCAELSQDALADNRVISLPGLTVTVGEMLDALHAEGGDEARAFVDHDLDEKIQGIVRGWPSKLVTTRADALGMIRDGSFAEIVKQFVEDELGR